MLGSSTLTTYADTTSLLQIHKVAPIISWEAAVSILRQWAVLLKVILGPEEVHPMAYNLTLLIESVEELSAWMQAHTCY